jgi:hypothetical protein
MIENPPTDPAAQILYNISIICFALGILVAYYLPSIVAIMRRHPNWLAIVALDVFAGWTLIGWVAALVWSLTAIHNPVDPYAKPPGPGMPQQVAVGPPPRSNSSGSFAIWIVLPVLAGLALLIACPWGIGLLVPEVQKVREAADRTTHMNDLQQVGLAIYSYYDANKQMPANANDLKPLLSIVPAQRLRDGEIEVIWNAAPFADEDRGKSNVIVGWDTKPAANGERLVLFMDACVRTMSEDAFRNTPKVRTQMKKDEKKTKEHPKDVPK